MFNTTRSKRIGKGSSAKLTSFKIALAETIEDLQAFKGSRKYTFATDDKGHATDRREIPYVVYCFNYGHDLVTRSTIGNEGTAALERRMKTMAWIASQPDLQTELTALQLKAASEKSMKCVNDYLDETYMGSEADIESNASGK